VSVLARLLPLDYRRRRLLKRAPAGPLRDFLATPFPDLRQDYREVDYVALDLETSGLDSRTKHILSIGHVTIHEQRIHLDTARHVLLKTPEPLQAGNVGTHRLTDDMLADGQALSEALHRLLPKLASKVLLAHHAQIEIGFLRAACQQVFNADWIMPVVDTQWLARQQLERRHAVYQPAALRLASLREAHHLPRYPAHHALSDALATAELFLAETARMGGSAATPVPLKKLLYPQ
jgi:DNA polymerase-3 subunit epsilon